MKPVDIGEIVAGESEDGAGAPQGFQLHWKRHPRCFSLLQVSVSWVSGEICCALLCFLRGTESAWFGVRPRLRAAGGDRAWRNFYESLLYF